MDSMSYRNNRPAAERQAVAPTSPPAPQPSTPAPVVRSNRSHESKKTSNKTPLIIGLVFIVLIVIAGLAWMALGRTGPAGAIDGSKYQAVFFTNGQVYFGKLTSLNDDYMRLKNVYYLQNKTKSADDSSPQSASKQDTSDVELIKLGNEIHGPEDEMLVSKDQILFFENLKSAGTVSKTITNFQSKNNQ
jgi:hypothetical protein